MRDSVGGGHLAMIKGCIPRDDTVIELFVRVPALSWLTSDLQSSRFVPELCEGILARSSVPMNPNHL